MTPLRLVEGEEVEEGLLSGTPKTRRPATPHFLRNLALYSSVAGAILFVLFWMVFTTPPDKRFLLEGPHNWAQYSAYTPQAMYTHPPAGCQVDQVSYIWFLRGKHVLKTRRST